VDAFLHFLNSPTAERIVASVALLIVGGLLGWLGHRWKHYRSHQQVLKGDARDVASIEKIIVDTLEDGRVALRIRSCGRDPIELIFPNPAAREEFRDRSSATTIAQPLVNKQGKMGSYLLSEMAIWACGKVGEGPFSHDVWVMASVCEPPILGGHQSSTVILVRRDDLPRFRDWSTCGDIQVEHGSHGERILTLMSMASEYDRQSEAVAKRRAEGKSRHYEETMYELDLSIDQRVHRLPTKPVPWKRFEETLKAKGLS
jgi:hypothetical protein